MKNLNEEKYYILDKIVYLDDSDTYILHIEDKYIIKYKNEYEAVDFLKINMKIEDMIDQLHNKGLYLSRIYKSKKPGYLEIDFEMLNIPYNNYYLRIENVPNSLIDRIISNSPQIKFYLKFFFECIKYQAEIFGNISAKNKLKIEKSKATEIKLDDIFLKVQKNG